MAIEKTLDSYLEKPNTDFALLLTSKWGVGKTYFVKKYFEKIANDTTVAYISLYGLSSKKEIDSQIFAKFYPNKQIIKKYGGALLKVLARNLDISDFLKFEVNPKTKEHEEKSLEVKLEGFETITDLFGNAPIVNKSFKALICLDDLERKSEQLSLKEVCGYINFLTESGFKVLVISNNDQIFDESFRALKEKTFGVEVVYTPNIEQLANSIINEIINSNEGYKKFLLKNINLLLDVFFKHTHNLRLFKLGLYHFEGVWNELSLHEKELSNLNLENTWPDLIRFICAILIESREGKLNFENKNDIEFRYTSAEDISDREDYKPKIEELEKNFSARPFYYKYYREKRPSEYTFYESIFDFIFKGILDKTKLIEEFKIIDSKVLKPSQVAINKCYDGHYGEISDEEFAHNLVLALNFVQSGQYSELNEIATVLDYLRLYSACYAISFSEEDILSSVRQILKSIPEAKINSFQRLRRANEYEDIQSLINEELAQRKIIIITEIFAQKNVDSLIEFMNLNVQKAIVVSFPIMSQFYEFIIGLEHSDLFKLKNVLEKRYFNNWQVDKELEVNFKKELVLLLNQYIKSDLMVVNKRNRKYVIEAIVKCFDNKQD